ncbi:helix-loop-helix protein delilah [Eupeodes corollae]|uniref:helix-loop-helix protein delilah n=1 Tax=Eupeodes corollae TaxID=290404 RepID=UPI002492949F|nr:helix-loop-helix protein delilah [Eupeodes corollae]
MKSTTCHKQTTTTSLTSATFTASDAAGHHRHHSQYRNNSISCRGSSSISSSNSNNIKIKPSDANNNDNSSMMTTTATSSTTTSITTAKLPIINSTPTRSSKNSEKYSLRQRQKRSFAVPSSAAAVAVVSSELKTALALDGSTMTTASNRSNLNSTTKRSNTSTSGSKEKSKSKAAPLSKYRRKTANARERTRMREINSAFENLRRCVPHTITGDQTASQNEKLTKITTLRLAMKYIRVLSEALDNPSFQEDFLLDCLNDGDHRFTTPNWVQPQIDVSIPSEEEVLRAQPTPPPQTRPKTRKTKLQTTKVANKRQRTKTKVQDTLTPYLTSSSTFSSPFSSSSSSAYASMSASPLFDDCHSMTDLSSMILESDGESLHLSEPCLSPMNRNYNLGIHPSLDGMTTSLIKTIPMTSIETENPLELSLRLLEPDADSLEFSTDQQPSSCISPLATLESFNPFGDLLHAEFPEHSSLDLFLT